MKKNDESGRESDDLRPEYRRSDLRDAVRGKYLEQYRKGTNLAILDPDLRAAFPTDQAVNDALRSLIQGATGAGQS
jgi:hypothetical protein